MKDAEGDDVLALNKCIYGYLQATKLYHKQDVKELHKIGFNGREVGSCFFRKRYEKGVVFVAIYVDDNLIVGHPKAIEDTIEQVEKESICCKKGR